MTVARHLALREHRVRQLFPHFGKGVHFLDENIAMTILLSHGAHYGTSGREGNSEKGGRLSGRLLSRERGIHCSTFMRTHFFQVVSLALLLTGCATHNKTQPAHHQTAYNKPLTSPGAKFGILPPVVQRTVLAEAGPAEVVDAVRDTSTGRVVYKIYFRDNEVYPTMYVAPDGSVLNPDLTVAVSAAHGMRVRPTEVPAKVTKAISERATAGDVAYINQETWGGRTVYVVTFKDEAHYPRLLLADDGTVVDETP